MKNFELVKWGRDNEGNALKAFYAKEGVKHMKFKLEKAGLFLDKTGLTLEPLLTVLCIANAMEKVFWKLSVGIIYVIHSLRKILINVRSFQRIMVRLP